MTQRELENMAPTPVPAGAYEDTTTYDTVSNMELIKSLAKSGSIILIAGMLIASVFIIPCITAYKLFWATDIDHNPTFYRGCFYFVIIRFILFLAICIGLYSLMKLLNVERFYVIAAIILIPAINLGLHFYENWVYKTMNCISTVEFASMLVFAIPIIVISGLIVAILPVGCLFGGFRSNHYF
ncbi:MAG: hypothetical protein IJS12_05055 [Lachnospiraceae bacterium]|nr:hypothetical protein [Lachnospiraceae bacterium]